MSKKFNIVIDEKEFESDEDGFLNLNEIRKELKLPSSKTPSKWNSAVSRCFYSNRNLVLKEIKHLGAGVEKFVTADECATVGYAMWISPEFYLKVVGAFVALRNGELAKAYDIAQSTANTTAENAFDKWMSYADTPLRDACGMLGIKRVMLFMSEAKKPNQLKSFIDRGILKYRNYGDKGSSIRITSVGKHFIKDNIDTINDKLEEIYNGKNF